MTRTIRSKGTARTSPAPSLVRSSRVAGKKANRVTRRPAPVLVRNDGIGEGVLIRKRTGRKNRRRYDVALSVPGAEVRLPSLPQIQIGWRLVSGALVMALSGLLYYLWTSPLFHVQAIETAGLQRVPVEEIQAALELEDMSIFEIHPGDLQANLAEIFPEMSAITVEVDLPAQVLVTVSEREPVLHWKEDNEEAWVDAAGVFFPLRGDSSGLPVIAGDLPFIPVTEKGGESQRAIETRLVEDILDLSAYSPPDQPLMYEEDYGLGWRDPHGWEVYFGMSEANAGEMEMKLKVYAALVDHLQEKDITPALISVEFLHAPYYRMER